MRVRNERSQHSRAVVLRKCEERGERGADRLRAREARWWAFVSEVMAALH